MRPPCYAPRIAGSERTNSSKDLHENPFSQNDNGGDRQQEDKHKGKNARPRKQQDVSAHYTRNRATRTEGWHGGLQIEEHMKQTRPDPTDKVEQEIKEMAEEVLDVIAKNVQKPHVADHVHP